MEGWKEDRVDMEGWKEAPPVIYIVQPPKGRSSLRDALGCLHIICGAIALITGILGATHYSAYFIGIWTSVVFFVCGGLTIGGARSGNKSLVVATLGVSVISAVSAGALLIDSSLLLKQNIHKSHVVTTVTVLQMAIGVVMLGASITSSVLSCRTLGCASDTRQTAAQYMPGNRDIRQFSDPTRVENIQTKDDPPRYAPPRYAPPGCVPPRYEDFLSHI